MAVCFVIQPFDGGKYDKRFDDVFKPAIESAGLDAYRVDRDPSVEIPIEAIEDGIRHASVCLADITTDNPNVWYELGFAFAVGRPVVMVCGEERTGRKFPFDIQHRAITPYSTDAPRDFDGLRASVTERIKSLLNKSETLRQIAEAEQVAPTQGLSQSELTVLAVLAGETSLPSSTTSTWSLKNDVERAGLTPIGFSLGFRRLIAKGYAVTAEGEDDEGNSYTTAAVTDLGWSWIDCNHAFFALRRKTRAEPAMPFDEAEIPF